MKTRLKLALFAAAALTLGIATAKASASFGPGGPIGPVPTCDPSQSECPYGGQ